MALLIPLSGRTAGTLSDTPAPASERRVVLRLQEASVTEMQKAAEALVKADLPFVLERMPQASDTPGMKSLLAYIRWKNNLLTPKVELTAGVELIDVVPGKEDGIIAAAAAGCWKVKLPQDWMKVIKEENRRYSGRIYYVSASSGDDARDGLSPATAWKTLKRVNDADLGFGDKVLFRRGDIFRGHLEPQSGAEGAPITYAAWGEGEKPVLEPSYDAGAPEAWEKRGGGLWRCVQPSDDELGNIILDHGKAGCAWKVDRKDQISRDLQFCWVREEQAVYLKSRRNPGRRFSSVELAEKQHVISETGCHDLVYENLSLRYGAAHGIGGSDVRRIVVRACDISWIGGSTLYFDEEGRGVRYGNGIEFWSAASDILVEGCRIWECWDAGLTNQSNVDGVLQERIVYRGNEIWNCEYSYEYWQQGEGARTRDVVFENNVCRDAGKGWGHRQRWNPNAAHLMFYDTTAETARFLVRGNRFERSENCGMRLFNAWYASLTMEGNIWEIPSGLLCRYHGRPVRDLIYKYPDRLDRVHADDESEIQGQTVEPPEVFGAGPGELARFRARFHFE